MKLSIRQSVELFHLVLLSMLGKKLDKQQYALKGGCNLRFFFGSPRYSEDMDLDLGDMPAHVVRDKVNAILESLPFRQVLAVSGLAIEHITEHKQTETTQRWKLGLHVPATATPVPTKLSLATQNAMSLSYDDFKGQVLAYLGAEDQAMYDSPDAWDAMQLSVVEGLEQLHESD